MVYISVILNIGPLSELLVPSGNLVLNVDIPPTASVPSAFNEVNLKSPGSAAKASSKFWENGASPLPHGAAFDKPDQPWPLVWPSTASFIIWKICSEDSFWL